MTDRVAAVRDALEEVRVDALLVSDPDNVSYLSGFAGDSGLLCIGDGQHLVTDGRFETQAPREAPGFGVVIAANSLCDSAVEVLRQSGAQRIGFEADHITFSCYQDLKKKAKPARLVPTRGLVGKLRIVKDEHEIALLREAVLTADRAFARIAPRLRPGRRERIVASDIERLLRSEGADKPAFDTICASGPNAAMPHARPTDRRFQDRELVKLDFGARRQGYCSDLTRTVCLGKPTPKQRRVHNTVRTAQLKAIEAVRPGVKAKKLDRIARRYLEEKGFGKLFRHSLGHGVGREVHEQPRIGRNSEDVLEPGMVFTIEPGIYIEDWGGVRLEDIVLVTEEGCEVLTTADKPRL